MLSGRRLDLLNPSPDDIEAEDIAHGLSRVARWNGQTKGPHAFSVAQHSLLVEAIFSALAPSASREDRLAALLHDAPEYVVGDMISPFKAVIGGDYKVVEARLLAAIHNRFNLPSPSTTALTSAIKKADRIAAFHEAVTLAGFEKEDALTIFGAPPVDISFQTHFLNPMSSEEAKATFLHHLTHLKG
ncbi:MAG: hydrolase [Hyphomicrobiales bacterium]|jgi:5'-deoxynucleotidase YfbR-like HD superfamily hydrolase